MSNDTRGDGAVAPALGRSARRWFGLRITRRHTDTGAENGNAVPRSGMLTEQVQQPELSGPGTPLWEQRRQAGMLCMMLYVAPPAGRLSGSGNLRPSPSDQRRGRSRLHGTRTRVAAHRAGPRGARGRRRRLQCPQGDAERAGARAWVCLRRARETPARARLARRAETRSRVTSYGSATQARPRTGLHLGARARATASACASAPR